MITLTLPKKFEYILEKDIMYRGETLKIIANFSEWIKHNYLDFFPEYTDHGIEHIQSVLDTAEQIINNESWNILTPEDVYVLVASILLHDSAMYIDRHGLWSLISDDIFNGAVLGKRRTSTWIEKWQEFEKRVKKFEESDWNRFFGQYVVVELPNINDTNLNDYQKVLIGDFVRQHHADIAETIASYGIPCSNSPYELFDKSFTTLNQLAGFIAKSHNYSLREMIDEFGEHNSREYRKTHPSFLMGVLRIADYLQFESKRTPKILFQIKGTGMCSPISFLEWKKHLSILDSNQSHSDAELLYVDALPDDVKTLEGIKKLLTEFQNQLDSFWAVNGEIYSRYVKLSPLGINLRRVKSNLDDPYAFVEQHHKSFYPETLHIKSDNQKIFPILVGPLYGDIPQIGLRELLQNSIDACNERFSSETNQDVHKTAIPYKVEVTIDLDNNEFTIYDNGIGMDIDVVKNYFLKIGASYRFSEVWKATHTNGTKGYVPRTGKFGIGMLAGFLIGDKITVLSKKSGIPSDKAVMFTYRLDSHDIQIDFTNTVETGTKIIISSNKSKLTKLIEGIEINHNRRYEHDYLNKNWSSYWYYLDTPVIEYCVIKDGVRKVLYNPDLFEKNEIFTKWYSVEGSELDGFYWTRNYLPELYCNGILIRKYPTPKFMVDTGIIKYVIDNIFINIFDNSGKFPLTLTRDGLVTNEFFELEKLRTSVLKHHFNSLNKDIQAIEWTQNGLIRFFSNSYHVNSSNDFVPLIAIDKNIVTFGDERLKDKYIVVDYIFENQNRGLIYSDSFYNKVMTDKDIGYSCYFDVSKEAYITRDAISTFVLKIKPEGTHRNSYNTYLLSRKPGTEFIESDMDGWVFVKEQDFKKLGDYDIARLQEDHISVVPSTNTSWKIITKDENINKIPVIADEILKLQKLNSFIFVIYMIKTPSETEYSKLWNKYE